MKVNIEIDCTPEEARSFMGLPDVSEANSVYVENVTKAMQGVSNPAQLQEYAQALAPTGQMGMKLFQNFVEGSMRGAMGGAMGSGSPSSSKPESD